MSQLNNKTNTAKKTFLMLLIFTVICVGVTVGLIYNTLSLKKENNNNENITASENVINLENTINYEKEEAKVKESTVEKVELTDKYFNNGIVTEEKRISLGDIVYEYEDNVQRKLEIRYVQISGLKNITIQEEINKDIENHVLSLRDDEELKKSDIERIEIYANVYGNFSDVLSVSIIKSTSRKVNDNENDYEYEHIGLNYSLEDGEKIKFNDLFTEDASIKNIITQSVYNDMVFEYAYSSETLEADMDEIDYGNIEDKVFKILSKYNKNPDLNFYFSSSQIAFTIDNVTYTIEMVDFYESIAIYTRYKSKNNLYQDESLVKNVNYVFSKSDMTNIIVDVDNKTDNFYYEILTNPVENDNEDRQKAEKAIQDIIYKKINEYAVLANKNKEKGYILSVIYHINENDDKTGYYYMGYLCSMDRKFYDEKLEGTIAASYRQEVPELWAKDYSWEDRENIIFEEEVSLSVEDFNNPIETESIRTREDREITEVEIQY